MIANVVSIEGSGRRVVAAKRGFHSEIELSFFDAFNYVSLPISELVNEFDVKKFEKIYGRQPASGEIGALLSHFSLWKKLLDDKSRQYHLILEDDFVPRVSSSEILDILDILDMDSESCDVIILGYSKVDQKIEDVINTVNPVHVVCKTRNHVIGRKFHETTCGAVAYIASRKFMKKILSSNEKPYFLIDDWRVFKEKGFNICHVKPLCFYEDYLEIPSDITASGRDDYDGESKYSGVLFYAFARGVYRVIYGGILRLLMFFGIYSSR